MPHVPEDYPFGQSEEEILEFINEYSKHALKSNLSIWSTLIKRGQDELARRIQQNYLEETAILSSEIESLRKSNQRFSRNSMFLNWVTIALAGITMFIGFRNLSHMRNDLESDESWQAKQIELLEDQILQNEQIMVKQDEVIEILQSQVPDITEE